MAASMVRAWTRPTASSSPPATRRRPSGRCSPRLAAQQPAPAEVIVVDDGSTDATGGDRPSRAGRGSSCRPEAAVCRRRPQRGLGRRDGRLVVFLDSDVVPAPGGATGVGARRGSSRARSSAARGRSRPLAAGAGSRTSRSRRRTCRAASRATCRSSRRTAWSSRGPRRCAGTRATAARTRSSALDALAAGIRLVFDPRFHAAHDHGRRDVRRPPQPAAAARLRARAGGHDPARGRAQARARRGCRCTTSCSRGCPSIYRRLDYDDELRRRFLALLPRMIVAEWTLGLSSLRYVARRPAVRT